MKLIEIETGKVIDMVKEGIYMQGNKIYAIWGGYDGMDREDVTDKYRIESDVRSREEIEEEMEILQKSIEENQWDDYFSTQECAKLEALEWVLKG